MLSMWYKKLANSGIHLLKFNDENIKAMFEICSKLIRVSTIVDYKQVNDGWDFRRKTDKLTETNYTITKKMADIIFSFISFFI